ncbi:unnamed protein product [Rhizoctonia solani]|uniref:Uncharacterized protein n=1 Tax=Rhizoctonia solani TaxID=456999 RepID=A0A8H2XKI5_9AGAM|nr:unnamed protein product [Rhizoctonia solani]
MSESEGLDFYHSSSVGRHNRLSAWFFGPNGENSSLLGDVLLDIMKRTVTARKNIYDKDPDFITAEIQESKEYQREKMVLSERLQALSENLQRGTVPFWSPRYNAHMASDTSMPALLSYISTALFNPNNISPEAAPLTSELEVKAGIDICHMLGFSVSDEPSKPWGHITCGGSVANMEAVWAARNLKFYPLSLFKAMGDAQPLEFIRNSFEVTLCNDKTRKLFKDCSTWELLNLKPETILEIPYRLEEEYDIAAEALTGFMHPFLVQTVGRHALESEFEITKNPVQLITTATKHYSFPKGCALAGIGSANLVSIPVDVSARMDILELDRHLNNCLEGRQAVYAVVAIMGSTDHGAVDPLAEICNLRRSYQLRGMSFVIHADGAWGGYFASLLRSPNSRRSTILSSPPTGQLVPERHLSDYVTRQFKALDQVDSVTVDPHKSGYVPFPAGGLCYRDGRMRYQLTWFNPSGHGSGDPDMNLSVFGIEGSKPGAAAAAVWLSNLMLGLDRDGYGMLLAQAKFGSLKMYSHLATMDMGSNSLIVVPLVMLPAERENASAQDVIAQKEKLIARIRDNRNENITEDDLRFASNFGSDLSINSFACNFRIDEQVNADIAEANDLNQRIYERLSMTRPGDKVPPVIIMLTEVNQNAYGKCAEELKRRLGLIGKEDLKILVNCVMSPFPTTSNFTKTIATEFRKVAEDVIQNYSLFRNRVTSARFYFIMQGTDPVHLVLLPSFHVENHRRQLILTCKLSRGVPSTYLAAQIQEPKSPLILYNKHDLTLEDLLKGEFEADIIRGFPRNSGDEAPVPVIVKNLHVTILKVIKNHRLNSRFLDISPPRLSIFYLYGTPKQLHIEHALLVDKNVQLTSNRVTLSFDGREAITSDELSKGLVAVFSDMHERTFLPVVPPRTPSSFKCGKSHRVLIYQDPTSANTAGPGLFDRLLSAELIGTGSLTLGDMTIADSTTINVDPWRLSDDGQTGGHKERPYRLKNNEYGATHEMYRRLDRRTLWDSLTEGMEDDYYASYTKVNN